MSKNPNNQINSLLVDMIITCLKANTITQSPNAVKVEISYLIGQITRQYGIPSANWHISDEAQQLWCSLTTDSIDTYTYKERIKCDVLKADFAVNTFIGAARTNLTELTIKPSDKPSFNNLFICEHIVPISDIISAIEALYNNNPNNPRLKTQITEILDKMHIARILRVEDRRIQRSSHRILAYDIITKSSEDIYNILNAMYYQPVGISLK